MAWRPQRLARWWHVVHRVWCPKLGKWGSNLCNLSGPAICEASHWGQRPWWGSIWDTTCQSWIRCGAGIPTMPHLIPHHALSRKKQCSGTVGVHTWQGMDEGCCAPQHARARGDNTCVWEVDEVEETNHKCHVCSHTKQNLIFWHEQLFLLHLNL